MNDVLVAELKSIVGPGAWSTDDSALQPHLTEWRGTYRGRTAIMVLPQTTAQVAQVVAACAGAEVPMVVQGGNTGLSGGAIPDTSGTQVLIGLSKLNRIRAVAAEDFSITAEAGCVLAELQRVAAEHDRLFPLSLAAEGSCQIGGNLSTNAGGTNVLRYGTARRQVLGLEVVLPNGDVWDGLRTLRKDTAGYDVKQLFIGAEGTLGIITAASLRLYARPRHTELGLVAVSGPQQAVALFAALRESLGDGIQAFEYVSERAMSLVTRHIPNVRRPLGVSSGGYVLLESTSQTGAQVLEAALAACFERNLAADAVLAKNVAEQARLWRLRHSISEAQKLEGASLKHDVSVPVGEVGRFTEAAEAAVLRIVPNCRVVAFGHVGDGNVHFNVSQPKAMDGDAFLAQREAVATAVYDIVAEFGGSISAEHGVGVLKRHQLPRYKSAVEIALMKSIKDAIDPRNLMNPGKVL